MPQPIGMQVNRQYAPPIKERDDGLPTPMLIRITPVTERNDPTASKQNSATKERTI